MSQTNLPTTKRFYSEDYKEAPPWFQRFLSQLNLFTEPMYNILNGGVDLTLNTNEESYTLQVNNANALGAENTATFIPKKFVGAPHGILLGQVVLNGNPDVSVPIGTVNFNWTWTGSAIAILAIYGLQDGSDYTLTLRIY